MNINTSNYQFALQAVVSLFSVTKDKVVRIESWAKVYWVLVEGQKACFISCQLLEKLTAEIERQHRIKTILKDFDNKGYHSFAQEQDRFFKECFAQAATEANLEGANFTPDNISFWKIEGNLVYVVNVSLQTTTINKDVFKSLLGTIKSAHLSQPIAA